MLEIESKLLEFNERLTVSVVTVKQENCSITVYGTGLATESLRYADLAQARALVLAQQIIEDGVQSVQPEAFVTDFSSVASPPVVKKVVGSSPSPAVTATDEVITTEPIPAPEAENRSPLSAPDADIASTAPPPPAELAPMVEEETDTRPDIPW